jgi:hypothetical protein
LRSAFAALGCLNFAIDQSLAAEKKQKLQEECRARIKQIVGGETFNCEGCFEDKKVEDLKENLEFKHRACDPCFEKIDTDENGPGAEGEEGVKKCQGREDCGDWLGTVRIPRSGGDKRMCHRCRHTCEDEDCEEDIDVEPTAEELKAMGGKRLCQPCFEAKHDCEECGKTQDTIITDKDGLCGTCRKTCQTCDQEQKEPLTNDDRICETCLLHICTECGSCFDEEDEPLKVIAKEEGKEPMRLCVDCHQEKFHCSHCGDDQETPLANDEDRLCVDCKEKQCKDCKEVDDDEGINDEGRCFDCERAKEKEERKRRSKIAAKAAARAKEASKKQ